MDRGSRSSELNRGTGCAIEQGVGAEFNALRDNVENNPAVRRGRRKIRQRG